MSQELTEEAWLSGRCGLELAVNFLIHAKSISQRKICLLSVAACRRQSHWIVDPRSHAVVDGVEAYADGKIPEEHLHELMKSAYQAVIELGDECVLKQDDTCYQEVMADIISRLPVEAPTWFDHMMPIWDIIPFVGTNALMNSGQSEQAEIDAVASEEAATLAMIREIFGNPFRPVVIAPRWRSATVLTLATSIDTHADWESLPLLADALSDAGCDSDDLLTHLRSSGPHVRGCWALDLITGKN